MQSNEIAVVLSVIRGFPISWFKCSISPCLVGTHVRRKSFAKWVVRCCNGCFAGNGYNSRNVRRPSFLLPCRHGCWIEMLDFQVGPQFRGQTSYSSLIHHLFISCNATGVFLFTTEISVSISPGDASSAHSYRISSKPPGPRHHTTSGPTSGGFKGCMNHIKKKIGWWLVYLPLWLWLRHLGWWHSQY